MRNAEFAQRSIDCHLEFAKGRRRVNVIAMRFEYAGPCGEVRFDGECLRFEGLADAMENALFGDGVDVVWSSESVQDRLEESH